MDSPPSPPSPPTPEWIIQERFERDRVRQEEINKKSTFIKLVITILKKFTVNNPLTNFFSDLINSDMLLEKRYNIAVALHSICEENDINNREVQLKIIEQFKKHVLDPTSALYIALNYQRNIFSLTFFGEMHWISWNYAKSLQLAQSIVHKEQIFTSELNQQKFTKR